MSEDSTMNTQESPESVAPSIAELESRLQHFVDQAALRLKADVVTLHLYDAERDKFYLSVGHGLRDQVTFKYTMPRSDRIAGKIVKGREPVVANDAKSHPDMGGPFTFREHVESAAGFPIHLGGRATGVLFVSFREPHTFTEEEQQAIGKLLQGATEILAVSRLSEARQVLASLVPAMSVTDKSLDFIIKSVCTSINVPAALWILEPGTNTLVVRASTGLRREFLESASVKLDESNSITEVMMSRDCVSIPELEEDRAFPFRQELQHEGWRSMFAVPVWAKGKVVGVLAVFAFTVRDFAAWEREVLVEMAWRIGDVLTREQHSQIVANLHQIGLALASRLELPQVLRMVVDVAAEVFDADIVTLHVYDASHDEFVQSIAHGIAEDSHDHPKPSKTGIAAQIVHDSSPIFSDDAENDSRMSRGFILWHKVKSSAGFPLKIGDEVMGVLFVNYRNPYKFLESDRELLSLFASQAALAIKNARLFREEQRRVIMAQIAKTLSETLDRRRTLQALVDGARQLTDATNSSLYLFNLAEGAFELSARSPKPTDAASASPRSEEGLTRAILDMGQPILIADASQDTRVRPSVVQDGTRSILGVPVQVMDERVGVLYVNSEHTTHFSHTDIELLQSLADYGAIAIERTRPLEAITKVNEATANILRLDELITDLLSKIVELGFEFAALQLINREQNTIETVDGINAPWGAEARHSLNSNDIQADIVRTRRTEIIAGPDPRFDQEIYKRFGHENLVRIFTPIIACGEVLGTVEAGYDRRNKSSITQEECSSLEDIVAQHAPELRKALLSHALEVIVANAVKMVQAQSGSIHILYNPQTGRYVYEACAGRIGSEFLEAFPPTAQGIGHRAMREGTPLWIDDPEELEKTHHHIYAPEPLWDKHPDKYRRGEGVRAIACFPLVTGGKYEGVFYVHFWSEHTFSEDEVNWLRLFTDEVSAVIQNTQFYEKLRERSRALTSLSMTGHSLISEEPRLANLLDIVARRARDVLGADIVTIYQYDGARDSFSWPPTIKGGLHRPRFMYTPVEEGDAPWVIVHELHKSCYAPDAKNNSIMCNRDRERSASKGNRFVDREGVRSSAGVLLIVRQETVGVMFVNYRTRRDFTDSERRVIENFASYAAIAIRTARQATRHRIDQLETVQSIDKEISSTLDLDRVLNTIVEKSMEHLGVTDGYGILQLFDEKSQELIIRAHRGLPLEKANVRLHINDHGITPRVARTRKPVLLPDTAQEPEYAELVPEIRSELAVPLVQDDRLVGVLNLESRTLRAFDEADVSFLMLLASQAVVAIQNAQYVQQLEQLRRVLQTITSTTDLQTVLAQITKSTLTVLGADDAVVFPYDSGTEEFTPEQVIHDGQAKTDFRPGLPKRGGTTYTVLDQGLVVVDDVGSAPPGLSFVPGTGLLGELDTQAFVGVALKVREGRLDKPLGVLYVDYRSSHRFTQNELRLIRTFADQAAIAINNARSYEALQKARDDLVASRKKQVAAETTAALGDIAGNLVHRMNNSIGAIRGFSQQIGGEFEDNAFVQEKIAEIQTIASESLQMIRDLRDSLEEGKPTSIDLNDAVQSACTRISFPKRITLELRLSEEPIAVYASREHLTEVFHNLLENAVDAIEGKGTIEIETRLSKTGWVEAWVADSGKGIKKEYYDKILTEPFFTTKPEGKGLGYGLWWLRTYVQRLGGDVTFTSQVGRGTKFVVELPLHS